MVAGIVTWEWDGTGVNRCDKIDCDLTNFSAVLSRGLKYAINCHCVCRF